jgi:hypothetical protein
MASSSPPRSHVFGLGAETGEILWHNGLSGLGHEAISLAAEGVAIHHVHKKGGS